MAAPTKGSSESLESVFGRLSPPRQSDVPSRARSNVKQTVSQLSPACRKVLAQTKGEYRLGKNGEYTEARTWLMKTVLSDDPSNLDRFLLLTSVIKLEKDPLNMASHLIFRARTLIWMDEVLGALADLMTASSLLASLVPAALILDCTRSPATTHQRNSLALSLYLHLRTLIRKLATAQPFVGEKLEPIWFATFNKSLFQRAPASTEAPTTPRHARDPHTPMKLNPLPADATPPVLRPLLASMELRPIPPLMQSYAKPPPVNPNIFRIWNASDTSESSGGEIDTPNPATPSSSASSQSIMETIRPVGAGDVSVPDLMAMRLDQEATSLLEAGFHVMVRQISRMCTQLQGDDILDQLACIKPLKVKIEEMTNLHLERLLEDLKENSFGPMEPEIYTFPGETKPDRIVFRAMSMIPKDTVLHTDESVRWVPCRCDIVSPNLGLAQNIQQQPRRFYPYCPNYPSNDDNHSRGSSTSSSDTSYLHDGYSSPKSNETSYYSAHNRTYDEMITWELEYATGGERDVLLANIHQLPELGLLRQVYQVDEPSMSHHGTLFTFVHWTELPGHEPPAFKFSTVWRAWRALDARYLDFQAFMEMIGMLRFNSTLLPKKECCPDVWSSVALPRMAPMLIAPYEDTRWANVTLDYVENPNGTLDVQLRAIRDIGRRELLILRLSDSETDTRYCHCIQSKIHRK